MKTPTTYNLISLSATTNDFAIEAIVECPHHEQPQIFRVGTVHEFLSPNPALLFTKPLGINGVEQVCRLVREKCPNATPQTATAKLIQQLRETRDLLQSIAFGTADNDQLARRCSEASKVIEEAIDVAWPQARAEIAAEVAGVK